jgi:hypothetical protein
MEMISIALGYSALVWVISSIISTISSKYIKKQIKIVKIVSEMWCLKCTTFWVTLAFTFNPFIAAIAALCSYIIDNYLNEIKL